MNINYKIQTFDNQTPPQRLKTINIRNASVLPSINHILNIDFEDYIVQEVRHRVAYKTKSFTKENGILTTYQEIDDIDVIAIKRDDDTTYSLNSNE
ncbi:hypothetical protein [Hydrogenovibrio sp. SC-1]|uniref:hypothetical protein n=1 Tax=Hydrogenovibrio sp. SC-1 TaxID=2065820 RepID=UPI00117B3694|nr:hypothetical protein [Hydrogenovibrio sp. SC-1]